MAMLISREPLEPLASPYLKGLQAQQDLLREAGGLMSSEEVASMLRLTRQAVDKRRQAGKLIAIPQGQRGFGYPVCQFDLKGSLLGLDKMLACLDGRDGWTQLTFLLSPHSTPDNRSPLHLMRQGLVATVCKCRRRFGATPRPLTSGDARPSAAAVS